MTKVKNLTDKEKKAVDVFLETGDRTQAIEEAYPNNKYPEKEAADVFGRPRVKKAVQDALDKLHITHDKILSRFDKMATKGKNEAAKVRANENLAQISDMYPDKTATLDMDKDGISIAFNY